VRGEGPRLTDRRWGRGSRRDAGPRAGRLSLAGRQPQGGGGVAGERPSLPRHLHRFIPILPLSLYLSLHPHISPTHSLAPSAVSSSTSLSACPHPLSASIYLLSTLSVSLSVYLLLLSLSLSIYRSISASRPTPFPPPSAALHRSALPLAPFYLHLDPQCLHLSLSLPFGPLSHPHPLYPLSSSPPPCYLPSPYLPSPTPSQAPWTRCTHAPSHADLAVLLPSAVLFTRRSTVEAMAGRACISLSLSLSPPPPLLPLCTSPTTIKNVVKRRRAGGPGGRQAGSRRGGWSCCSSRGWCRGLPPTSAPSAPASRRGPPAQAADAASAAFRVACGTCPGMLQSSKAVDIVHG
jgi:hypothetical protein